MENKNIENLFKEIEGLWKVNLKEKGVKFFNLKYRGNYSKNALVLCFLYSKMGEWCSKDEITLFVREYHPETSKDLQQMRHLGASGKNAKGFWIQSDRRGNYKLVNLKSTHPYFDKINSVINLSTKDFEGLKKDYSYKCATCGEKEGESHRYYGDEVKLQKGHMDPNLPLEVGNVIPQCNHCNQYYKDMYIFNEYGQIKSRNDKSAYWS